MTIDVTRINDTCIVCDMDYYYCADKFLELINMTGEIYIDCNGLNLLSQTTQTITGLHARLIDAINTDKLIMAVNMLWGELSITPIPVFAIDFGDYIICTASTLQVIVTTADVVTVNNMAPAN